MSTTFDKKIAVRVANSTKSPYTIRKNTGTAEFSVVTLGQSESIETLDTAILGMIHGGDPYVTT